MKKAQVMGLPITYIFIAIVAALILIVGISYVIKFTDLGEKAQLKKTLNDIKNDINRVYQLNKDSSQTHSYNVPSYVQKICFRAYPFKEDTITAETLGSKNDQIIEIQTPLTRGICIPIANKVATMTIINEGTVSVSM